jgi:hypothetical protein
VDVFSAKKENENKRKDILKFDIEKRNTDLEIFLLKNIIINKSSLKSSDSGDKNNSIEIIIGDLIS